MSFSTLIGAETVTLVRIGAETVTLVLIGAETDTSTQVMLRLTLALIGAETVTSLIRTNRYELWGPLLVLEQEASQFGRAAELLERLGGVLGASRNVFGGNV